MRGERQSKIYGNLWFKGGDIGGGGGGETEKGQFSSLVLPSSLRCRSPLTRALHIFSLKGKIRDYSQFTNKRVKNPNWQEANELAT